MHRFLLATVLLLTGCQNVVGPFERRSRPGVRVDDPRLTIDEQEKLGRERLPAPENSPAIGPRTYAEPPVR